MNSTTLTSSSSSLFHFKPTHHSLLRSSQTTLTVTASAATPNSHHPKLLQTAKQYAKTAVLIAIAATAAFHKSSSLLLAHADEPAQSSPLSDFLGENPDAIAALKSLLQQNLENGEDGEALKILRRLSAAEPDSTEWKFLTARVLSETGDPLAARSVFEEILSSNPFSFEALFENALLMDRSGESHAALRRLEEALKLAEEANRVKEARDVKLIMAQIQLLQKNVEDALMSYDDLVQQDPTDFRPYFCRGVIYSLLDRNDEARVEFDKYRELSPNKFEVDGYLRKSLSRINLFGSDEN